jgi:hypothetical protein
MRFPEILLLITANGIAGLAAGIFGAKKKLKVK